MSLDKRIAEVLNDTAPGGPHELSARSVFFVQHGTRLDGSPTTYRNRYIMVRAEGAFGVCAVADGIVDESIIELSGASIAELLGHPLQQMRVAALDAYLGAIAPHRLDPRAKRVTLPAGTPEARANARDDAIANLVGIERGMRVALIGVVNPLVAAIHERGGRCLPCDLDLRTTHWGDPIERDMQIVLEHADLVLATGMTIGNGTFEEIRQTCLKRATPLVIYAQTAAAVARSYLGDGVSALCAEPMPLSQMSAEESSVFTYDVREQAPERHTAHIDERVPSA